jgi:hypothetical protein
MSLIVNPNAGNAYFTNAGSAITAQPTLSGRSKNLGSNRTILNNVAFGFTVDFYGSKVVAGNHIGGLLQGNAVNITSVAASGGFAVYTLNSHALVVGDIINVTDTNGIVNGSQRVTAKDTNTFTTTKPYVSGAGTMTYKKVTGNFATMTDGDYVMMLVTTDLAGASNDSLLSAASFARRPIHKLEAMRTTRTATAVRAGFWNVYTGEWSTKPTSANDISDWGTDDAAVPTYAVPGELVYRDGSASPILDEYKARTQ